jgi:hypothetical protein
MVDDRRRYDVILVIDITAMVSRMSYAMHVGRLSELAFALR